MHAKIKLFYIFSYPINIMEALVLGLYPNRIITGIFSSLAQHRIGKYRSDRKKNSENTAIS